MDQIYAWRLIGKKISGESSDGELYELLNILRNNPELHYPMQTIIDLWNPAPTQNAEEVERALNRHLERMREQNIDFGPRVHPFNSFQEKKSTKNSKTKFIGLALLILVLLAFLFWYPVFYKRPINPSYAESGQKTSNEISTKSGSRTKVMLPDGTSVWMNADSRLIYDKNYGNSDREVYLTGEAFIEMLKNKEKPFIIHTGKIEIRVLGTTFNVKSYPGEKTIETSLVRGSIEVTFKDRPLEKVILKPNEKLVVANDYPSVVSLSRPSGKKANLPFVQISHLNYFEKLDSTVVETAWVENKLIFQDESFESLARRLERWFGVKISFADPEMKDLHFTGIFMNESILQALNALKVSSNFNFKIEGKNITILK
jgi:ferric-dicitrate binding protein FerR (iron transport regulator)